MCICLRWCKNYPKSVVMWAQFFTPSQTEEYWWVLFPILKKSSFLSVPAGVSDAVLHLQHCLFDCAIYRFSWRRFFFEHISSNCIFATTTTQITFTLYPSLPLCSRFGFNQWILSFRDHRWHQSKTMNLLGQVHSSVYFFHYHSPVPSIPFVFWVGRIFCAYLCIRQYFHDEPCNQRFGWALQRCPSAVWHRVLEW